MGDYNYTVKKDKAAAIGNFQKVIEIDPADKQAKDVMQGLINEPKK